MDRTPSKKQQKEWSVSPSPRSLEVMYQYVKNEHDVKELFYRMLHHRPKDLISWVILEETPLLKAYDLYLDVVKKNNIPVVVLDSTTSASGTENGGFVNNDEGGVA
ncbi:hypothetical protein ACS0TY_014306 [Phlomoides rotata]